jgi:multidrug efflux pump
MMCAYLDIRPADRESRLLRGARIAFEKSLDFYRRTVGWALDNPRTIMFILLVAVVMNVYLLAIVPKGFFPTVDEGRMQGGIRADQSISFQLMQKKFVQFVDIIRTDPAVASVGGFTGGGNSGNIFVTLKPPAERGYMTTDQVIDRLRPALNNVAGARLFLQSASATGVRAGGRQGNGTYQYTVLGDTLDDLNQWVPKITDALNNVPELQDVNSDQQDKGLEVDLKIDRPTASRLGLNTNQIDSTLYDAFGQRQVSTLYKDKNQYHVVMEVAPAFWQSPETLRDIYVSTAGNINGTQASAAAGGAFVVASAATSGSTTSGTTGSVGTAGGSTTGSLTTARTTSTLTTPSAASSTSATTAQTAAQAAADAVRNQQLNALTNTARGGASTGASVSTRVETMVPLSAFVSFGPGATPLAVNHQGPFVATTFSFGLPDGEPLSVATAAIQRTMAGIDVPISVHAEAAGTFQLFQKSLANEPLLLVTAVITIYIVLGMLYESLIHPLTILSTLPSAGVGAVLALLIFKTDFSLIALIGVILLIGIVKKNAIILIDFAISLQREKHLNSRDAIYQAALMRFRPIMMTTLGAILGALPLAIGLGEGSELRQPLGISIVGGLLLSQALTLYTTPVVYLYLDRFGNWSKRVWNRWYHGIRRGLPRGASGAPAE